MPPTVEIPPLQLEARAAPSSINLEARTVEVVWSRGAKVLRRPWFDEAYHEELSLDPAHVRLERLNNVGPVLDGHMGYSTRSQLGSVQRAWIEGGEGRAILAFRSTEEAIEVFKGIQEGHVRAVSVGYRVHKFEDMGRGDGDVKTLRAVDWEPYEISVVPIPADDGVEMRNVALETNPCQIIQRHEQGNQMPPETNEPKPETRSTAPAPAPAPTAAPVQAPEAPAATRSFDEDAVRTQARDEERTRVAEITKLCTRHGVTDAVRDGLIDKGRTVDQARTAILDSLAERDESNTVSGRVDVGREDLAKRSEAVANVLEHRMDRSAELTEAGREMRSFSLMELGRELLQARGASISGMDRVSLAGAILGRAHSTSDFPKILQNIATKRLLKAYREAEPTFEPITERGSLPDFKEAGRVRLSDAPALQKRNPDGGEYKSGTLDEWAATNQLDDYGVIVELTRKAIINDDLNSFDRILQKMSRRARHLEEDLVWAVLLANAAMSDSTTLFHATHGNLITGSALSIATLGAARSKMRLQKDSQGSSLNPSPAYLIVPPALETTALQLTSTEVVPTNVGNLSVFRGMLDVIVEPRLEHGVTVSGTAYAGSATSWYLAAKLSDVDIIELATLEGSAGPRLEQEMDFRTDGIAFKVGHDAGAAAMDYRGLVRADA